MSCDIVMGNVAPLKHRLEEIREEALKCAAYWNGPEGKFFERIALMALDKSEKQFRDKVRGSEETMQPNRYTTGNFSGLVEGEGPMGYYGDV